MSSSGSIGPLQTITSPERRSPCSRGKTMRDFEEELADLKRENFDLKMRIYLMEDQRDLLQGVESIDEIYEINSSLKKELETLRKEISDKDDLILKAGDAMNMLVNKHKEEVGVLRLQAQNEVDNLREKMENLHQELLEVRENSLIYGPTHNKLDDSSLMFSLPYSLPIDNNVRNNYEINRQQQQQQQQLLEEFEIVKVNMTAQINDLVKELKEKNHQLDESLSYIDSLKREIHNLKEVENNLRSEIVSKGGQINVLQGELAEKEIDTQALKKQINYLENKFNSGEKSQAALEEQILSDGLQKLQLAREHSNYIKLKNKYDNTRQESDQLSNQIVELHKRLNDLQIELQAKEALNTNLNQELETLKTQNAELLEDARMLQEVTTTPSTSSTTSISDNNNIKEKEIVEEEEEEVEVVMENRTIQHADNDETEQIITTTTTIAASAAALATTRSNNNTTTTMNIKKINELTTQLQELFHKLRHKERELKEAKHEYINSVVVVQKLLKQNKSLTKDVENMKVLLGKKEILIQQQQLHQQLSSSSSCKSGSSGSGGGSSSNILESLTTLGEHHYRIKFEEISNKLVEVEKERDMLQTVMEQQVMKLVDSLKEKETMIEEYKSSGSESQQSEKENRIEELEKQVAKLMFNIDSYREVSNEKQLHDELEEKKKEIEHLNEELRRRTFNLQELVNKELWDKNREIEKLNKTCERKQTEVNDLRNQMQRQERELQVLNEKLQELSDHINVNICKIPTSVEGGENYQEKYQQELDENHKKQKEIECLLVKFNMEIEKNRNLSRECIQWKVEAEQHEKARKELTNACTSLITRLEELASFLDSLLPLLGAKKRRILQQVIDRSREASRSFSISFFDQTQLSTTNSTIVVSPGTPILPDFSHIDFCSEDDTMDVTLVQKEEEEEEDGGGGDGDNRNTGDEVAQIREQVDSMVEKLRQARLSPEKSTTTTTIITINKEQPRKSLSICYNDEDDDVNCKTNIDENLYLGAIEDITGGSLLESSDVDKMKPVNRSTTVEREKSNSFSIMGSESEGWSEPDKNVSMARIGIKPEVTTATVLHHSSDESLENVVNKAPCVSSSGKKRHEEIRRLNLKVKQLEKLNTSLLNELRAREKRIDSVNFGLTAELQIDGLLTKTLLDEIKKQREKLQASLMHNEFLRNQLEGALTCSIGEMEGKKSLVAQLREMSAELERSCSLCIELEKRCISLETERTSLKQMVDEHRNEVAILRANLKEKENEALEGQCSLLDLQNKYLILERTANTAETRAEEDKQKITLLEEKIIDTENSLKSVRENWAKAAKGWINEKQILQETYEKKVNDMETSTKKMKNDLERANQEQRQSLERVHKKLEEIQMKRTMADNEWKQRLDILEKEKKKEIDTEMCKRMELERKLLISYEKQSELRQRLETEMSKSREIESSHKTIERWWRRRLEEADGARAEREAELKRRLDAAALTTSEALLDKTRLANDRLRLQAELRRRDDIAHEIKSELERRVAELEAANKELENKITNILEDTDLVGYQLTSLSGGAVSPPKSPPPPPPSSLQQQQQQQASPSTGFLLNRQRSNPTSDYTSDPDQHGSNGNLWFPVCGGGSRNNNNASPDLGIESDQGRLSSLDVVNPPLSPKSPTNLGGELNKLELENTELRAQLYRTRKALEDTYAQLTAANQRKRQVERAICKQLTKTHYILQKARTNLESSDDHTVVAAAAAAAAATARL